MKTTIRPQSFETNSSSQHALVFSKNYDMSLANTITGTIYQGEFGWGHDIYTTPYDKLSYLWTALESICYNDPLSYSTWEAFLRQELNISDDVVFDNAFEDKDADYWNAGHDGYVDHASELANLFDSFMQNPELLRAFVYGEGYIETGNDNDGWPEDHPMNNEWDGYYWDEETNEWKNKEGSPRWEEVCEWNGGWIYLKGN